MWRYYRHSTLPEQFFHHIFIFHCIRIYSARDRWSYKIFHNYTMWLTEVIFIYLATQLSPGCPLARSNSSLYSFLSLLVNYLYCNTCLFAICCTLISPRKLVTFFPQLGDVLHSLVCTFSFSR